MKRQAIVEMIQMPHHRFGLISEVRRKMAGIDQRLEEPIAARNFQTVAAFRKFRDECGGEREPNENLIANDGELQLMSEEDGLFQLEDGPADIASATPSASVKLIDETDLVGRRLWVVRSDDVVHAEESCKFGRGLPTGVIKHTNLTGGAAAFVGGEMLKITETTLIISGRSGRYRPRSSEEMDAVARAFKMSGYNVWSMGYDNEADFPFPFIGAHPQWVA